ncbi:hypothetical protein MIMGU_mgv1a023694mg [Erythranthe guttata]|uniref:F-box domain-containing protein n=1 Tax=Erythranthe guttata TaxID=4155 RepID=A0A022S0Y8_ERYGU|nr:hypothetical protein MIMGU_mgv1a023694mg [Erythranthe guttata]
MVSIDDRLSDLPDSVLCRILSFLRTKVSVRTSILAKRWRYVWSYVPDLYFRNDKQYAITRVLMLRKVQYITTFRLVDGDGDGCIFFKENKEKHETDLDKYLTDTWITFVVERNVKRLHLSFRSRDRDHDHVIPCLPVCLFTCKTLVDLKLESCGVIPTRVTVCLPRLKKLHLLFVRYEADESIPHLLSGCPVLEDLRIELYPSIVYCHVSSPTVKRLVLNFIEASCGGRADRLEINTPSVEYLEIRDYFTEHIECGAALTSLTEADICFEDDSYVKQDYFYYSQSLLKFFDTLCNVDFSKTLIILKSLGSLRRFIECNIKYNDDEERSEERKGWKERPQQVAACLLSHLRIVKLVNIRGEKHELEIINYLLRNAKVLERMEISYPESFGSNKEINMLKNISLFHRGSAVCEVAFGGSCWW